MVYLIIVLVLCSIVISILKLKPSKHEKMLGALRSAAISDGLVVRVVWLKEFDWIDNAFAPGQFVAYQRTGQSRQNAWHCVPTDDESKGWQVEGELCVVEIDQIRQLRKKLGERLIAVERLPVAIVVYWLEEKEYYSDVLRYLLQEQVASDE